MDWLKFVDVRLGILEFVSLNYHDMKNYNFQNYAYKNPQKNNLILIIVFIIQVFIYDKINT